MVQTVIGFGVDMVPANLASIFASKSSTISWKLAANPTLKSWPQSTSKMGYRVATGYRMVMRGPKLQQGPGTVAPSLGWVKFSKIS